jgi:penicillin-binding protein 1A
MRLRAFTRISILIATAALLIALTSPLWLKLTPTLNLNPPSGGETVLLAVDGSEIARVSSGTSLLLLPENKELPVNLVSALLLSEDRRFYSHSGVDPIGLGRAFISNLRGLPVQGGSTITQQLVRNQTSIGTQRTLSRKAIEALFALRLEASSDKEWILRRYIDTVWLGNGIRGMQTASKEWFSLDASQLSLGQSASIVATLPCPETCNPIRFPEKAEPRRQRLLDALEASGDYSAEQIRAARLPLTFSYTKPVRTATGDSWVLDTVRRELASKNFPGFESGQWPGGLVIQTTIHPLTQSSAQAAVLKVMGDPASRATSLDAALAVVQPGTGALQAIIGGRDFSSSEVNIALGRSGGGSGRQGGSTAKTFGVIAALEAGYDGDMLLDAPMQVLVGDKQVTNSDWLPYGSITLASAAKHSVNTAFINLTTQLGPDSVADVATRLGVLTPKGQDERVVIGVVETSPIALAGAYAAISAKGLWVEPHIVTKVFHDSLLLYQAKPTKRQAISPEVAAGTIQILRNVTKYGTGYRAAFRHQGVAVDIFGKTGTTNNAADTWFAGSTSSSAAAVWIGNPKGVSRTSAVPGFESASGGAAPAQIWNELMRNSSITAPLPLFAAERPYTTSSRPTPPEEIIPEFDLDLNPLEDPALSLADPTLTLPLPSAPVTIPLPDSPSAP